MRVADRPVPPVTPHTPTPGTPWAGWPAQLRVALEMVDQDAYAWDDDDPAVVWDDPDPDRYVWDNPATAGGYLDAACDVIGLEISSGDPDELGLFQAGQVVLTLANPTGQYTAFTADGQLVYFAPGRRIAIWAHLDDADWWLAHVRVDRWMPQADGTVVIEASDGFSLLAREQGEYTPGNAGQTPLERITSIATLAGFPDPVVGDPGDVGLTRQVTDRSPLEEIQTVALSDAGIVHVDADGVLRYRDRLWPSGRDDFASNPDFWDTFSDNICPTEYDETPFMVWELELSAADDRLANWVRLVNVAGLVAGASAATMAGLRYPLTHPDRDQWTSQLEGDQVAQALVGQKSVPTVAIERFVLHVHDPHQDLWRPAIDRRIGDRIRFVHEQLEPGGELGVLDIVAVVTTIRHTITADAWTCELGTSRSVDYVTVEEWDVTEWVWDDDDDPDAVWRH